MFEEWQREFVDASRVARLATVSPSGAPHVVPVCFALQGARFWVSVDEKPKATTRLARLRNIAHESRVSLLFDRYQDDWSQLAWVRVDGVAETLERGDAEPNALTALRARYSQYAEMDLESRPLIVIEPQAVTAWRWAGG